MTRAATAHTGKAAVAADRCLMHVIVDHNGITTLPDGTRIADNEAARLACDCSIVVHHYKDGQPLYQSRRTRKWNTAQRRAALVRDGGHCRFPGCQHRIVDLHHHQDWDHDGKTDIDNGYNLCRHHHRLIHSGFQAHGQPDGRLRFYRPDRTPIGTTAPVDRDTISFSTLGRIE
ncbi:MAG TPA: HNH endonuclease signature motif containing protein [Acidimicrobiales bacterium]|nr:HNH endonuclease signature motif containing protein [Acidimicrobiales bacterium]